MEPNLRIVSQLTRILQTSVDKYFGHMRPNNRSLEAARDHAQKILDQYMGELMKESPELKAQWSLGHPFRVLCNVSLETRSYNIDHDPRQSQGALTPPFIFGRR